MAAAILDPTQSTSPFPTFPSESIESGTREHAGAIVHNKEGSISIGLWEMEKNTTTWLDYPVTEFMILLKGTVTLELDEKDSTQEKNKRVSFTAPQCFVIPKGLRCKWIQEGHVKKWFVSLESPRFEGINSASFNDTSSGTCAFVVDFNSNVVEEQGFAVGSRGGKDVDPSDDSLEVIFDGKNTYFKSKGEVAPAIEGRVVFCRFSARKSETSARL
tara:strand:- start:361 stop:1008 length:648 start_codon:yes stop_codon:yes gene_type:complete